MYAYKIFPSGIEDKIETAKAKKCQLPDVIKELERAKELAINQVWSFVHRVEVTDEKVVVHLNRPMEFVFHDDLCFTIRGEFGILGADKIAIDGKEIHLNSRNCKQLRELKETIVQEILLKIKPIGELEHDQPIMFNLDELKNQIKEDLREEFRDLLNHALGKRRS